MNIQEFSSKGGKTKGAKKAHTARFTAAQVNRIRASADTLAVQAKRYKTTVQTIFNIRSRRTYSYIP